MNARMKGGLQESGKYLAQANGARSIAREKRPVPRAASALCRTVNAIPSLREVIRLHNRHKLPSWLFLPIVELFAVGKPIPNSVDVLH